jgi:hypothetical protein
MTKGTKRVTGALVHGAGVPRRSPAGAPTFCALGALRARTKVLEDIGHRQAIAAPHVG